MANKEQVLSLHRDNPDWSSSQIANHLGCMSEYVRATLGRANRKNFVPKKPGRHSQWTAADFEALILKREIEHKKWRVIAVEMGQPLGSCFDHYRRIMKARAPSIVPEATPIRLNFHQQLGIATQVYRVAVLDDQRMGRRYDNIGCAWNHQHNYRESITLARVVA